MRHQTTPLSFAQSPSYYAGAAQQNTNRARRFVTKIASSIFALQRENLCYAAFMDTLFTLVPPEKLLICLGIAFVAGVIKGIVGFAMPMILISGLGSLIAPELALAGLIVPTLVTNGMQALRQGPGAAFGSIRRYRAFLLIGLGMLLLSAQLVSLVPGWVLLSAIGGPVVLFTLMQLLGWQPDLTKYNRKRLELSIGAGAGFIGGFSGVWGPPTVLYLTAMQTEKTEQMRVQGVIYGLGAVALAGAHMASGILNRQTIVLSLALLLPAVLGMWLGGHVQDRFDQALFRKATLAVLLVAGLNLLRRAFFG
jgi:uncharacterized membrane protein YfcA